MAQTQTPPGTGCGLLRHTGGAAPDLLESGWVPPSVPGTKLLHSWLQSLLVLPKLKSSNSEVPYQRAHELRVNDMWTKRGRHMISTWTECEHCVNVAWTRSPLSGDPHWPSGGFSRSVWRSIWGFILRHRCPHAVAGHFNFFQFVAFVKKSAWFL